MPFTAQSGAGEGGARGREVALQWGIWGQIPAVLAFSWFFYKHFDLVIFFFITYTQDF